MIKHVYYALQLALFALSCPFSSSAQVPQVQHVLIVVEENTDYADVCGPNHVSMPFLCSLKSEGAFSANYYAPTHPSIGNYEDMAWGVVNTNDDGCNPTTCGFPYTGNNIVRASQAAGKTWKGYAESLPSNCYFGGDSGSYSVRHSSIPYISDVQANCLNRYVAFEDINFGFGHDVAQNTLPNFAFITPNLCDDGHDCVLPGSVVPDQWLQINVLQPLLNTGHLDPNTGDTVVIVTFDESNSDNTNGGGSVYWFMIGKGVKQNYQSTGPAAAPGFYSHESSLRLIAELLGASLSGLGGAATAPDMTEFFGATTSSSAPVAILTVTPQTGTAPLQVTADSSSSTDPNGGIVSRIIDFGDGTTSSVATASHSYNTAGTFTVTLTISDNLHLTSTASKTVTVQSASQPVSVSISPASTTVSSGGTVQFAATVANSSNQAVIWTTTAGSISGTGLLTAPVVSTTTTTIVTARSVAAPSQTASATVTIQRSLHHRISVTVSPVSATIPSGGAQQFTATVTGTMNKAVTWKATAGTVSSTGLFTASAVLVSTTINVTAASVADPSKMASATVTVQTSGGGSAPTQTVQHNSGFVGSANSVAVNLKSNVTAGHLLLVAQSTFDGETLSTPMDSQGNAFALLATAHSPGASVAAIYATTARSTGPDTVTCGIAAGASDNIHCHIYEVSGATPVVDAIGSALQTGPSLSVSTSSATTNANDYVFAYFSDDVSESTYVAGSGLGDIEQSESASQDSAFSADKAVTKAGIQTATATASTSDPFVELVVALKGSQTGVIIPPSVSVSISPATATVGSNGTQLFSATVTNALQSVNWTATAGTISGGLFTAPAVSTVSTVTVTATSVAVPSQSASAKVQILPSSVTPSGPIQISGQNGTVVENLHISNPSGDCVVISNSTNVIIRRSEIGPCGGNGVKISGGNTIAIYDNYIHPEKPLATSCCDTHDGIFAKNTSTISIQGNVIAYGEANIEVSSATAVSAMGNFLLNPIDSNPSLPADGQSRGQNFQAWGNNSNITVANNYALSSTDTSKYLFAENQEDSINFGLTSDIIVRGNYITGGHSPSGCGLIADDQANGAQFLNNTVLDTGQCGIAIADGTNQLVDSNRVLNRTPVLGGGNTAIYVWKQYAATCGPVIISNNVATEIRSDGTQSGFWNGGGCEPVTLTSNTFNAAAQTLLGSPSQTMPPPKIPPVPKDCVAVSPFTNNTSLPACSTN